METLNQNGTPLVSFVALGGGVLTLSHLLRAQAARENAKSSHIGIETGGTSCKVGIMRDVKSLKLDVTKTFETTEPAETVQKICDYIN